MPLQHLLLPPPAMPTVVLTAVMVCWLLPGSAQHTTVGGAAASLGAAQPYGEFFSAPLTQQSHGSNPAFAVQRMQENSRTVCVCVSVQRPQEEGESSHQPPRGKRGRQPHAATGGSQPGRGGALLWSKLPHVPSPKVLGRGKPGRVPQSFI